MDHQPERNQSSSPEGRVNESVAAPDRRMIVLTSDPRDNDTDS